MRHKASRRDFLRSAAGAGASCSVPALVISSVEAATYLEQGRAQVRGGELRAGVMSLTRAIELDPTDEEALDTRSVVFEILGDHERAMDDRSQIIGLNPSSHNYLMRGVYAIGHDPPLAVRDFTEVIRQEPLHVDAYGLRGLVYEDMGEYDLAVADFTRAQALEPEDAQEWTSDILRVERLQGQAKRTNNRTPLS